MKEAIEKEKQKQLWRNDPSIYKENEVKMMKKMNQKTWVEMVRENKTYIFTQHILKYATRYGLKYIIFILTWILETGTDDQLYNIPIYTLYVIAFLLVFIPETYTGIYRICFWLYNLALLVLFAIMFVRQLNEPLIDHGFDLNATMALLLLYTFAYLYKHLNKVDRSLQNLMFKTHGKKKLDMSKLENQNKVNLRDILETEDQKQREKEDRLEKDSLKKKLGVHTYQRSNWIVFVVFLFPILVVEVCVYYCLMVNSLGEDTLILDSIYFVCLVCLILILNSVRAEDINKVFNRCVFFLLILFGIEMYFLVYTSLEKKDPETGRTYYDYDNTYTRIFKEKLKLVFVVLSLRVCLTFFKIQR